MFVDKLVISNCPFLPVLDSFANIYDIYHYMVPAGMLGGSYDHPAPCGMSLQPCSGSLPGWALGMVGYCIPETYGYRIGNTTGYTKAIMQVSRLCCCPVQNLSNMLLRHMHGRQSMNNNPDFNRHFQSTLVLFNPSERV